MLKRDILKNVGSSWFSLGINVVLGFFISPYILHSLGDAAFGIWVLIFSVTGYYGIFDLGIRSSVIRYIAKYTAVQDKEGLAKFFNTILAAYTCIALATAVVTLALSFFVGSIFHIQPNFLHTARLLFLMVGLSVALGFPLGIYAGILEGLQRFYLLNFTNVGGLLVRAALTILALRRGYGLLTVGLITVLLPLLVSVLRAILVTRILPIPVSPKYLDRSVFKEMSNYSGTTFIIQMAYQLRFKTDAMVIGTFLNSSAITTFSIGGRLVDYAGQVVSSMAQIFVPMASQSDAKGDMGKLRKLFVAGNRACGLIIFPVSLILIILGKTVIEAWVGAKYVADSYPIMLIVLIPTTLVLAQGASPRILFGMARHQTLAWVASMEGIANLILSIVLVQRLGVIGDAIGTAIPLSFTAVYFTPRFLAGQLKMKQTTFLREAYTLPILLCLPLTAVLLALREWLPVHHLLPLLGEILLAMAVYGAGLLWAVRTGRVYKVGELVVNPELEAENTDFAETVHDV
jgi:O-antigen/teichoic acid export membrane protein